MKKLVLFLIPIILFAIACEKKEDPRIINAVYLCFEKPFLIKTDSVYIGVRYFKNYKEKDNISVTLDGQSGATLGPLIDGENGINYLFRFPPRNAIGSAKVLIKIDNGQNAFIREKTLKIFNDYNLETAWDNFNYDHINYSFPFMYNPTSINFKPITIFGSGYFAYGLGHFFEKPIPNSPIPYYKFIPAINGYYALNYEDSKKLRDLTVLNGSFNNSLKLNYEDIINDMKLVYGQPVSVSTDNVGFKITKFLTTRLQITVYEKRFINANYNGIVTIVSLK